MNIISIMNKETWFFIRKQQYFYIFLEFHKRGFHMCKNRTRNLPVMNRHDVEVDKPGQWVLVHGVNVGEVSDGEEENGGVFGDGTVAHTTRVNLLLGLLCNLGKAKKRFIHSYVQRNFLHQHCF